MTVPTAEALFQRARTACEQRRVGEGIELARRAIDFDPRHARAHRLLGLALASLGRHAEALTSLDRAVACDPGLASAHGARGDTLAALGRPAEAIESYDRALALAPASVDDWCNRGAALYDLGRFEDALASYDRVLALKPDFAQAHYNRGNVLSRLGRHADALLSYAKALALEPSYVDALSNHGNTLRELGRPVEAVASLEQALALAPDHVESLNNLGTALVALNRIDEAIARYDRALALAPDNDDVRLNRGMARLRLGDFGGGWDDYERRRSAKGFTTGLRDFVQPRWQGNTPLAGKTILLHSEQGLGDAIQFVRYAPLVARRGATVVLAVQPPLTTLFSTMEGVAGVYDAGQTLPPFDLHCPLLSLPLAFKTELATIPSDVPYLRADADRVMSWDSRLRLQKVLRVGIAWAGNPKPDRNRSMLLSTFAPILAGSRAGRSVQFVSLQKEVPTADVGTLAQYPDVVAPGQELESMADTAAVISLLDLVISIDTSVAHLAGAIGKPVWILLPFAADFRWLLQREDSPWYPTARLFRQPRLGDWDGVVARVREMLIARLAD